MARRGELMVTRRAESIAVRTPGVRTLPWGPIGDVGGLLLAITFVVLAIDLRRGSAFLYLLFGVGVLVLLLFQQFRPRLPGLIRPGYRFVFVPAVTAFLVLGYVGVARDYYSRSALLIFVLSWTASIAICRYSLRRFAPQLTVLCIGSRGIAAELARQPRLYVQSITSPNLEYRRGDLIVVEQNVLEDASWRRWLLHAELANIPILSEHRAREALAGRVPVDTLSQHWAEGAFRDLSRYLGLKRGLDVVVVVLASPFIVMGLIGVGMTVLLESGRPILFRQPRIGRGGKPFMLLKFRTMRPDAEKDGAVFANDGDPRVTRVGAVLRKYRLDELPQFLNVFRGDMSIIGPRPEQVKFVEDYERDIPLYGLRHGVRPGITGWAQVRQGYAADVDQSKEKLSYDLYYIKNCSLVLDLLVVFHTVRTVLVGSGSR